MPNISRSLKSLCAVMFILLVGDGCSRPHASDNLALTQSVATAIVARLTDLPTITSTRTRYPTWTPVLPTSSKTPEPSWTLLPTLTDHESNQLLQEWLEGSPECRLPCWGGITPGMTTWQEANQQLNTVVEMNLVEENAPCSFGLCNYLIWDSKSGIDISGTVKSRYDIASSNDVIESIYLEGFQIYSLERVLSQYWQPDKIFLTYSATNWSTPDYLLLDIILIYPNDNFIVVYTWDATLIENNVVGCAQEALTHLFITDLGPYWSDDAIKSTVYGYQPLEESTLFRLEDKINMTSDEFYQEFKTIDGNECISIALPTQ